jgi:hypothetical protein
MYFNRDLSNITLKESRLRANFRICDLTDNAIIQVSAKYDPDISNSVELMSETRLVSMWTHIFRGIYK